MFIDKLQAQKKSDAYYLNILKKNISNNEKLIILDTLCNRFFMYKNEDFIKYAKKYVTIATHMKQYDKALIKGVDLSHVYYLYENNVLKSINLLDSLREFEPKLNQSFSKGLLYYEYGLLFFSGLNMNKAIENFNIAIQKFDSITDASLRTKSIYMKGLAYAHKGNFFKALNNYETAYEKYIKLNDEYYKIAVKSDIATLFVFNNIYDKAIEEHQVILDLVKNHPECNDLMPQFIINFSKLFRNRKDYLREEKELIKAEAYMQYSYYPKEQRLFLDCAFAVLYSNLDLLNKARVYIERLLKKEDYAKRNNETYERYLQAITYYLIKNKEFNKAKKYALLHYELANKWGAKEAILQAEKSISIIYKNLNELNKAYYHQEKYFNLKDSIYTTQKTNALLYYQLIFESEQKEKDLLARKNEIEKLKFDKKNAFLLNIISILSLIFLFSLILFYRNRSTMLKEQKMQYSFTSKLINHQENERKRISENLHDSLGQNLIVLKNKAIVNNNKESQYQIDQIINEIHNISYNLHPFQLKELGLTNAIKSIIEQINDVSQTFISYEIDLIDSLFTKEGELNMYRIIQELITNMTKYAKADACRIIIKKLNKKIKISIKDNGIGFDFYKEYHKSNSLGLRTIIERVRFLNGTIDFINNNGTEIKIHIESE